MKLSFVIPSFNSVTWIPHAVRSCLDQTHKDIEVVVVDDGSTDQTGQYLAWAEKQDKRLKIIRKIANIGRSAARNLGNREAQGDILMVLDADDLSTPNRAEIVVKKFQAKSNLDYLYGPATVIDALGRQVDILGADVFDKDKALKELKNRIVHSTAAYTHKFADRYAYPESPEIMRLGIDDWSQQISALLDGATFDFVPQRLACYRILDSAITSNRDEAEVVKAKKAYLDKLLGVMA